MSTVALWQVNTGGGAKTDGWRRNHDKVRKEAGVCASTPVWCAKHQLPGVPQQQRVLDAINVCYAVHHQKMLQQGDEGLQSLDKDGFYRCDLVIDTSQDCARRPWSKHVRSMCSGSAFFYFPQSRMVLPQEHLAILGLGHDRDLTGQSPAMRCCLLDCIDLVSAGHHFVGALRRPPLCSRLCLGCDPVAPRTSTSRSKKRQFIEKVACTYLCTTP